MAIDINVDQYALKRLNMFFPADTDNTGRDGNLTGQCVSLVKWFLAEMTSVPNPFIARGHAKDFGDQLVREGHAYVVSSPKRGDIVVWKQDGGGYGHIGVVTSGDVFEENVHIPGPVTRVVDGDVVYASRLGKINESFRRGAPTFYRVRTYVENLPKPAAPNNAPAIQQAYREILEREADAGGLNHYLSQMSKGWGIQQVRQDLMESAERRTLLANKAKAEAERKAREETARKATEEKARQEEQARKEAEEKALCEAEEKKKQEQDSSVDTRLSKIEEMLRFIVDFITSVFKFNKK